MIWNPNKECMSRDEMSALQGKRLHKIVEYVYHNVPFYRNKLQAMDIRPDDIQTIEDIKKLPFTTKQDLRDNYPFGLQAAPQSEIIRIHASSGTTGKPTIVGYTRKDIGVWSETMARCLTAFGVSRDDIFSVAYGYGLFTGGLGAHYGVEHMGASVIPAGTGNTEKHLKLIRDLGITGIACTPSYALYLAETMEKLGISKEDIRLRIGAFGAEPWTEQMRKEIEDKLGLKGYNIYGLSEIMGPSVSYECQMQNGSHINEDHFYPEIINPTTLEPLPLGQTGELVFTTLTKEGMPLLRYRTRDLCPSQVESVILSLPEFAPRYMLIVDREKNLDTLLVQAELRQEVFTSTFDTPAAVDALEKKLASKLKSVLSIAAKVQLKAPGTIERSQGKSAHVIDNRKL